MEVDVLLILAAAGALHTSPLVLLVVPRSEAPRCCCS
jgi:hypothetical protein